MRHHLMPIDDDVMRYPTNDTADPHNNIVLCFVLQIFLGNDDKDTVSVRHLQHPITARFIRLKPMTWHGARLCLRAEVFGCYNDGE